jgi:hypothetical protein
MILDNKNTKAFALKPINLSNVNSTDKDNKIIQKINNGEKNNILPKIPKIDVHLIYSYSNESFIFTDIPIKLINNNSFLLNDIFDELSNKGVNLNNTTISYFDNELNNFIFCGIVPFGGKVTSPYLIEDGKENAIIKIKSRCIIKKDNLMRMELNEEHTEQIDENNQNVYINNKSKRSKERKIGYIIEKVFLWRKLYNGFVDENGKLIKLTLEEAADKVKISKKSLDDYLIQLR